MAPQVLLNLSLTTPPSRNTTSTMTAAIAATIRPYSTAVAPSSLRLRCASMKRCIGCPPGAIGTVRLRLVAGRAVGHAGRAAGVDRAAGLVELVLDDSAEQEDHQHDDGGDRGNHEAVLDRGCAFVVPVAMGEHEAKHVFLLCPPRADGSE